MRRLVTKPQKKWSESGRHASRLARHRRMVDCLSSKETDHRTGTCHFSRKARSRAVEQREARRRKAAVETQPRVVNQDEAADRGQEARPCPLQLGHRQQAARL